MPIRQRLLASLEEIVGNLEEGKKKELEQILDNFVGKNCWTEELEEHFTTNVINAAKTVKIAFIIVDYQNDFVSGSLAIKEGDAEEDPLEALPIINKILVEENFEAVIYTMDWHPPNHLSFFEHARNPDRELCSEDKSRKLRPFDIVRFVRPVNTIQVLYPAHCKQGSWGAQLHPDLIRVEGAAYMKKGTETYVDSYSAFNNNIGIKAGELENFLRRADIGAVLVCGLAYDICVFHTLKDANKLGFLSAIVTTASKGLSEDKIIEANETFQKRGVAIVEDTIASDIARRKVVPIEWIRMLARNASSTVNNN